ncbi:MAG: hypothetical protein IJ545_07055 [Alphaproteobacteria bacterium]|nr:hypothetical protein [Alphaproteobacteria bacterium]
MSEKLIEFINKAIRLSKCLRSDWLDDATAAAMIAELEAEGEKLKDEVKNVLR